MCLFQSMVFEVCYINNIFYDGTFGEGSAMELVSKLLNYFILKIVTF